MSMLSRNFARLLMMGVFSRVCSVVLWGRGGLQFRVLGGDIVFFFGVGGEVKATRLMEFELCFTSCRAFKQP